MLRTMCVVFMVFMAVLAFAREVPELVQVRNITAFTRLWGYVKHFYPSNEAQEIDWDRFGMYGSDYVKEAPNNYALNKSLHELFDPIVADLLLYSRPGIMAPPQYSFEGFKSSYWQYEGYNNLFYSSIYRSVRANRPFQVPKSDYPAELGITISPQLTTPLQAGSRLRVSFRISQAATDTLLAHVIVGWQGEVIYDSLAIGLAQERSIVLKGGDDLLIPLWLEFSGFTDLALEHFSVDTWQDDAWQQIFHSDFSLDEPGKLPRGFNVNFSNTYGEMSPNVDVLVEERSGNKLLAITASHTDKPYTLGIIDRIFEEQPTAGEYLERQLVPGLYCSFPLVLPCDADHTYPIADSLKLLSFEDRYRDLDPMDRSDPRVWLAGVIRYWNELQFFYPYFEYGICDWEKELPLTVASVINCRDFAEYLSVMQRLKSKTQDGHAAIYDRSSNSTMPGFHCFPLDGKWVVNKVLDDSLSIPPGSQVSHMNSIDFATLMREARPLYMMGNPETTDLWLFSRYFRTYQDSVATFTFVTPQKETLEMTLPLKAKDRWDWIIPDERFIQYPDSIMYINANYVKDEDLLAAMPDILKARGIILDLRLYPSISPDIISQLLTQPDDLSNTHIKRYIRPNEELPRLGEDNPTWGLLPMEPHIGARVIALSSRCSQSYCEQFLQVLQHNKLATIVGQATSGANGDLTGSVLPGDLEAYWTGMLVRNHDKSRFHGIGIIPDVPVVKTLDDIIYGRDPELEKALEILHSEP